MMAVAKTKDGKSVTETENEVDNSLDALPPRHEQGAESSSTTTAAVQQQQEKAASSQPDPGIGIGSVSQQPVCESCPTKDTKIMELEEALKNVKPTNSGNHIEASSAHSTSYNSFDNSELSGGGGRKRKSQKM
jgi:hypothetical protein